MLIPALNRIGSPKSHFLRNTLKKLEIKSDKNETLVYIPNFKKN